MFEGSANTHFLSVPIGHLAANAHRSKKSLDPHGWIADKRKLLLEDFSTRMYFRRHQTVFNESEHSSHFYMVVGGAARVCSYLTNGRRQVTDFRFSGDCLGFTLQPTYSNTVEAASKLEVLRCSLSNLIVLAETIPSLRKELLVLLWRRTQTMERHVLALGKRTALERVASFLVMLCERAGGSFRAPFEIPMNRVDIADYLGLTTETVSRVVGQLKQKHFIVLAGAHQIAVNDIGALRALSG